MKLSGEQIIGYEFSKKGTQAFHGIDPTTGEKLEPAFYEATAEEIDQAVQAAGKCFDSYRSLEPEKKAIFLEKIADEILALDTGLIQRCSKETGLPEARLINERGRTVNQLKLFASVLREGSWIEARIDTAEPGRQPLPKPDIRQMLIPLGPVAVFGASNFPLAFSVAGGDTAAALAAGCPVIVKAHPAHPGTSELVARAIQKAAQDCGLPAGVVSLVQGRTNEVGTQLVEHPLLKAVGFTGSFRGGKAIFDAAVRRPHPIPVYAEMGSVNPVFILPRAVKERGEAIARGLSASVTLGVGQFCTNPGLVLGIKSAEFAAFQERVADGLAEVPPGIMVSCQVSDNYNKSIEKLVGTGVVRAVFIGDSGNEEGNSTPTPGVPVYLWKTEGKYFMEVPNLLEEVFGPSTLAVELDDREKLLQAADHLEGQLTATIHAGEGEIEEYPELVSILEKKVGRLIINGFPTGVEVSHAMHHGGPFPATTDVRSTSVGTAAIKRFARPICYQDFPAGLLPLALQDDNPLQVWRLVNGQWVK